MDREVVSPGDVYRNNRGEIEELEPGCAEFTHCAPCVAKKPYLIDSPLATHFSGYMRKLPENKRVIPTFNELKARATQGPFGVRQRDMVFNSKHVFVADCEATTFEERPSPSQPMYEANAELITRLLNFVHLDGVESVRLALKGLELAMSDHPPEFIGYALAADKLRFLLNILEGKV